MVWLHQGRQDLLDILLDLDLDGMLSLLQVNAHQARDDSGDDLSLVGDCVALERPARLGSIWNSGATVMKTPPGPNPSLVNTVPGLRVLLPGFSDAPNRSHAQITLREDATDQGHPNLPHGVRHQHPALFF
uniref:Uncharacterized protein n=1 Tax=Mycena chlorophos TaxID=658473 RepID=A0ABQ0M2G6_MYCCL|nr:predicted protein [Mycena chlorophos]